MSTASHRSARGVACVGWLDELVGTAGEPTSGRGLPRQHGRRSAGPTGAAAVRPRLWCRAMRGRRSTILALALTLAAALTLSVPASGQERSVLRIAFPSEDGSLTPYTFT